MLTEQGLYKVLMKSRKPIAEKFQDWVCEVIEENNAFENKKNFIELIIMSEVSTKQTLEFDGIFQGRESEIRITPDNMISVFDFIKVAGGQANPKQTWTNIQKEHKHELGIVQILDYAQFGKTKKSPVI